MLEGYKGEVILKVKLLNQAQTDHSEDRCTVTTTMLVDGQEVHVRQRIPDTQEGYRKAQNIVRLIIETLLTQEASGSTLWPYTKTATDSRG